MVTKCVTTLSLDSSVVEEYRRRRIKISPLVNTFLKTHLKVESEIDEFNEDDEQLSQKLTTLKNQVSEIEAIRERKERMAERKRQEHLDMIKRGQIVEWQD